MRPWPGLVPLSLRRALSHPRAALVLVAVGMALLLPALWGGFALDDHVHRLIFGHGTRVPFVAESPWQMFRFAPGDADWGHRAIRAGVWPWWTAPDLRLNFMRPVTVLTHLLDERLWPELPALMHAQSIAWYMLLCACVGLCYRRLLGAGWVAGLALLFYAVDEAHALPVAWLAHRSALVGCVPAVLALLAHDRWRRQGWRAGAVLGPLLLLVGLLSAEYALGIVGYLFAYSLCLDRGRTLARRLAAFAPYAGVVVGWRLVYQHLGYGASSSAAYVDPGRDPLNFLYATMTRLPLLLSAQFGGPPADLAVMLPSALPPLVVVAVVVCCAAAGVLGPLLRRDATCRFFAVGMLLSILPSCAAFPSSRLLLLASLGGFGLCARLIGEVVERGAGSGQRIAAVLFVVAHGVVAPLTVPVTATLPKLLDGVARRGAASLPTDPAVLRQDVVVVNAPNLMVAMYSMVVRAENGSPLPRRVHVLGTTSAKIEVRRVGDHTLILRAEGGYLADELDGLVRDHRPFRAGDRLDLGGWVLTVSAITKDGRPLEVRHDFARALTDPALRFVTWGSRGFVGWRPPEAGQRSELPAIDLGQEL